MLGKEATPILVQGLRDVSDLFHVMTSVLCYPYRQIYTMQKQNSNNERRMEYLQCFQVS